MVYAVITGYDKASKLYTVASVSDGELASMGRQQMYEDTLVTSILFGNNQIIPMNFGIDKEKRTIIQNSGSFSRFSPAGSAVVLAEIRDANGKTVGYRLLSCASNACVNMSTADILQRERNMPEGEHFLQNAVVRSNAISCYPNRPFPCIQTDVKGNRQAKARKQSKTATWDQAQLEEIANGILSGEVHHSVTDNLEQCKALMREMTLRVDKSMKQDRAKPNQKLEPFGVSRVTASKMANMILWSLRMPTIESKAIVAQVIGQTSKEVADVMLDQRFSKKYCGEWDEFLLRNKDVLTKIDTRRGTA